MSAAHVPWLFLVAAAGLAWVSLPEAITSRRAGRLTAIGLSALALAGYVNFTNPVTSSLHGHEWVHYYLGAKYIEEVGYSRLYHCLTVADYEAGRFEHDHRRLITDLESNRTTRATEPLADPRRCTENFSPARWDAFSEDVRFFRGKLSTSQWNAVLLDHGYNATPTWTALGRLLTATGAASETQLYLLSLLDPLYLIATFLAILWAFRWRTAVISLIVLTTYLPAEYMWTGRAFLRWDWLFYLVLAVCCLKRGKAGIAGAALACATLLRVFPGVLLCAAALCAVAQVLRRHPVEPAWRRLFLGAGLATAIGVLVTFLVLDRPLVIWSAFTDNLVKTAGTPFTNAVGLPTVLSWRPGQSFEDLYNQHSTEPIAAWVAARQHAADEYFGVHLLIAACFVALFIQASRSLPPWATVALATTLLPVASDLLCYYYMAVLATALLCDTCRSTGIMLLLMSTTSQLVNLAVIPGMPTAGDQKYVLVSLITVTTFGAILTVSATRRSTAPDVTPVTSRT